MNPADPGQRRRDAYAGPVLFSIGFRPFFLGAGLLAAAYMPLWLVMFQGGVGIPTVFAPAAWHAHEMIFGFAGAVIAGFLLTAIPNWTGRAPLQGLPLASLFASWLLGRAAMVGGAYLGAGVAAVLDLSFLILLLALALREIIGGRNWRNLPLPAALSVLIVANLLSHLDAVAAVALDRVGERLGIATVVLLICLIGGRIVRVSHATGWPSALPSCCRPPSDASTSSVSGRLCSASGPGQRRRSIGSPAWRCWRREG